MNIAGRSRSGRTPRRVVGALVAILVAHAATAAASTASQAGHAGRDLGSQAAGNQEASVLAEDLRLVAFDADVGGAELLRDAATQELGNDATDGDASSWYVRYRHNNGEWGEWSDASREPVYVPEASIGEQVEVEVAPGPPGEATQQAFRTLEVASAQERFLELGDLDAAVEQSVRVSDADAPESRGEASTASVITNPRNPSAGLLGTVLSADSTRAADDYNQPCGNGTLEGRNAFFGIQTSRTPAVA